MPSSKKKTETNRKNTKHSTDPWDDQDIGSPIFDETNPLTSCPPTS